MTEITFEKLLESILKLAKLFEVLEEAESKVGFIQKNPASRKLNTSTKRDSCKQLRLFHFCIFSVPSSSFSVGAG